MSALAIGLLLGLAGLTPADEAVEVQDLLNRWQAELADVDSFTCRFQQSKRVSFMRRPLQSSGQVFFQDGQLVWRTEAPSLSFLALDQQSLRIYHPEFNTLEIYGLADAPATDGMIPGLTTDPRRLQEQYRSSLAARNEDGSVRLRFVPRQARDDGIAAMEVTLGPNFGLRAWKVEQTDGDEVYLTISEFARNAAVSPDQLKLEVPGDVEIIRYGRESAS